MIELNGKLLFALPKKGRLHEKALHYIDKIDLQYVRRRRQDIALCTNFDLAFVFLPADEIALYVGEGNVDLGITGQDVVAESQVDVEELLALNFGKCRLCLQAPVANKSTTRKIVGGRVASSFPHLTRNFFSEYDSAGKTTIKKVSGSVEAACALGLADAVVDLVESGETMKAAGLEIVDEIMRTEAVLIMNAQTHKKDLIDMILKRLKGVLTAEKYAMIEYNIEKDKLALGEKITPGRKAPTVLSLENPDWVAVKSMILKSESNNLMDQLEEIGAQDILVSGMDNCRV